MALIKCNECGHRISSRARNCTKCGAVNRERDGSNKGKGVASLPPTVRPPAAKPAQSDAAAWSEAPGPSDAPPRADEEAGAEQWYYVCAAGRRGPIPQQRLLELAEAGEITPDTLIWRSGLHDWIKFQLIGQLPEETPSAAPPPAAVGNTSGWVLSLAPLWGTAIQIMCTDSRIALTHEKLANYNEMWWIMVGLNVLAAYLDRQVRRSGPEGGHIRLWWCLAVPFYIFRRDAPANAGMTRLLVWIGSLLLSLATLQFLNKIYTHQIIG